MCTTRQPRRFTTSGARRAESRRRTNTRRESSRDASAETRRTCRCPRAVSRPRCSKAARKVTWRMCQRAKETRSRRTKSRLADTKNSMFKLIRRSLKRSNLTVSMKGHNQLRTLRCHRAEQTSRPRQHSPSSSSIPTPTPTPESGARKVMTPLRSLAQIKPKVSLPKTHQTHTIALLIPCSQKPLLQKITRFQLN